MSVATQIPDVVRTLIVCITVGLLGYLGYSLMKSHMEHPAPRVVNLEANEVKALRAELVEAMENVRRHADEIAAQVGANAAQAPTGTIIEYGAVRFEKPEDYEWENGRRIQFKNRFKAPPLILTGQCPTAGRWTLSQARKVSPTEAMICVDIPPEQRSYKCRIVYLAIGERAEGQ
jgi:hypothetical protein